MHRNEAMVVEIVYTNYRGETSTRRVLPRSIRFASSEWHPEPQWLLDALDCDKGAERSFALKDIHKWTPAVAALGAVDPNAPKTA